MTVVGEACKSRVESEIPGCLGKGRVIRICGKTYSDMGLGLGAGS